jgi:hypothetical protein
MIRVVAFGGRSYRDWEQVFAVLDHVHKSRGIALLIQGGASGADDFAWRWAKDRGVPHETYHADWQNLSHPDAVPRVCQGRRYDARAGLRRNQRMVDEGQPQLGIAFPGSDGTRDMKGRLRRAGIEVMEVKPRRTMNGKPTKPRPEGVKGVRPPA